MTINLTNILTDGSYVNSNIRIEKTSDANNGNGIKITLSSDVNQPATNPAASSSSDSYIFRGTAAEIKAAIEAEPDVAALSEFFVV